MKRADKALYAAKRVRPQPGGGQRRLTLQFIELLQFSLQF